MSEKPTEREKKKPSQRLRLSKKENVSDLSAVERLVCELRSEGVGVQKACKIAGISVWQFYRLRRTKAYEEYKAQLEANRRMQAIARYKLEEGEGEENDPNQPLRPLVPLAVAVLEQALSDATLPMRLRLDAAREILDRAGVGKTQKVSVSKQISLPPSLRQLAEEVKKKISLPQQKDVEKAVVEGEVVEEVQENE